MNKPFLLHFSNNDRSTYLQDGNRTIPVVGNTSKKVLDALGFSTSQDPTPNAVISVDIPENIFKKIKNTIGIHSISNYINVRTRDFIGGNILQHVLKNAGIPMNMELCSLKDDFAGGDICLSNDTQKWIVDITTKAQEYEKKVQFYNFFHKRRKKGVSTRIKNKYIAYVPVEVVNAVFANRIEITRDGEIPDEHTVKKHMEGVLSRKIHQDKFIRFYHLRDFREYPNQELILALNGKIHDASTIK